MSSRWAKRVLTAGGRAPLLVSALSLSLSCGNTESNTKKDEPAENVPFGSECLRHPLSDYCATRTCPANQTAAEAEAQNQCASGPSDWYRQATACGGVAIGTFMGYQFFDDAGDLTGVSLSLDIGSNGCGDGVPGLGKTIIYGTACALTGEPTDLCMP